MPTDTADQPLRARAVHWRIITTLAFMAVAVSCTWYFSSRKLPLAGEWKVVSAWSDRDLLTRRNVRVGAEISISRGGYFTTGRLGLDGIVGSGICGMRCATLIINGSGQMFRVTQAGKSKATLVFVSLSPPAVIVAERAKPQVKLNDSP